MNDKTTLYAREAEQDLVDELALRRDRRDRLRQGIASAGPRRRPALERIDAEFARRIAATERRMKDAGDVRDLLAEAAAR